MTSDFLLLQKIRNGNNHAGNQFVEKYYSFIYQYCFLHIHNQECAEDMVQETFVRFFGALMSGAEIGKAKSYLYSIAGNIIKNYYKKKKEILLDQLPDIEKDNLTEIEIRLDVERALDLLPEEMLDKEIYYDEGIGGKWSFHFPGNVMQIYPGNAIGLGSAPEELEVARNTVQIHALVENALGELEYRKVLEEAEFADKDNANNLLFNSNGELENGEVYSNGMESGGVQNPHFYKAGAFNASNLSCLFFTAAVRVGYDPKIIWKEMRDMILNRGIPNGFLKENPHGIEQLNTIPDAIQEMMLQSCEGIIRIFPVWPRAEHPNASFRNFRAWGGFEVSAALKNGEVERVTILSHKGHPCRIENPWPGKSVKVSYEYGRPDEVHFGEYLNIELHKEEHAELVI